MRTLTFVLVLGMAILLSFAAAFANGNGDVTIKIDGRLPIDVPAVYVGSANTIEIWIKNDAPLYGISLALSFDFGELPFHFETPYGILPDAEPYLMCHGSPAQWFNPDSMEVRTDMLPNTILIQGTTSTQPLPVHTISTHCYSLMLNVPCGSGFTGQLAIDNVFLAPNGTWMFDDGAPYAPTFQGQPNTSMTIPDAPAVVFSAAVPPCGSPFFTATPTPEESISHCPEFIFTFGAQDTKCGKGPLEFSSSVGEMNPTTGQLTLLSGPSCEATVVTAIVTNSGCMTDEFTFTVNWIDAPVTLTNCPTSTVIRPNDLYEYPFRVTDQDVCDEITCAALPVGAAPAGVYQVGSNGKFSFTPATADSGYTYVFDLIANSGCGSRDSCRFSVEVGSPTCGDVNGDKSVNISDAVHLISYIFSGGLPPNPLPSGNVDCSMTVNISDAVYLISYVFSSGSMPCAGCP